jgi:hypothetical protein
MKGDTMNENQFIHGKLYPKECWNPNVDFWRTEPLCDNCMKFHSNPDYFTMPVEKLIARLDELDMLYGLDSFLDWADDRWMSMPKSNFIAWLISQPRFTTLLYEYLKKGE